MTSDTGSTPAGTIALIGNPNSGKTSVFNALTGLRQKVANYPGVTIEKKEGTVLLPDGTETNLIDLPGTYSLLAKSPDERIAVDVLLGCVANTRQPELVICVVDASNLERNLYLATQVVDYGIPVVIALNMMDVAEQNGITISPDELSRKLGVPIVPTVASRNTGIDALKAAIVAQHKHPVSPHRYMLPEVLDAALSNLRVEFEKQEGYSAVRAHHEAISALISSSDPVAGNESYTPAIAELALKTRQKFEFLEIDFQSSFIEHRYNWIKKICDQAVTYPLHSDATLSDKVDRVLTHKVWGFVFFFGLMGAMFQSIFVWANGPMEWISAGFNLLGGEVMKIVPAGDLQNLLVNGVMAGVGAVVTFVPQIAFLFLFIGLLEDTGYMARAAFIMDRVMSKVGLHGKSFIPLLSSFACAIPGIMSTRTLENRKDRLVTMLVAPLMSCSARLPVYALLIAAFIPQKMVLGIFSLPGIVLVGLYVFGLLVALAMAWIFKKTLLKSESPSFIMELPDYKMPSLKSIGLQVWERSFLFLKRAGTFIFGVSIILWFLATYPKIDQGTSSERLEQSFAGRIGRFIEPAIKPLGFDWKIGIGLVSSMLQREVFVSTMGTIYNIKDSDQETGTVSLGDHLRNDVDPVTGRPAFTILTAICLMVYYALAMQCMSTTAVMRRETNGWKWPAFQFAYMTILAYSLTFLAYRIGLFFTTA